MSADNTIAILKTPDGVGGFEYRVVHAQAIENIYYEHVDGNPEQVVAYFGNCKLLTNRNDAWQLAKDMEKEVLEDDFCPILEYGINEITLPHQFSYYHFKILEKDHLEKLEKNNLENDKKRHNKIINKKDNITKKELEKIRDKAYSDAKMKSNVACGDAYAKRDIVYAEANTKCDKARSKAHTKYAKACKVANAEYEQELEKL